MNSTLKSLVFWVVLVVVGGLVWNFSTKFQTSHKPETFSEFMTKVDAGQVARVTITGNEITYATKSNDNFRTYAPPQYEGLEALYRKYRDRGFEVLGFPANDFGAQEPGSDAEIAEFCSTRFDVTFPMFAKVDVNGAGAHPLFQWLKSEQKGIFGTESIKWNFTKFLIGPDGHVIKRYGSADTPEDIAKDV